MVCQFIEELCSTSGLNVWVLLIEGVHDAHNTGMRIGITLRTRAIRCFIQRIITCELNLCAHLRILEISLSQEPVNRVLTLALGRIGVIKVTLSGIEELIRRAQARAGAKAAAANTTCTTFCEGSTGTERSGKRNQCRCRSNCACP